MKRFISTMLATFLLLGVVNQVNAADLPRVVKLRLSTVALFDGPNGNKTGEMKREDYVSGAWQVVGEPQAGFVKINTATGTSYWVKSMAIDTDKRVAISAECNAKIAGSTEKIGATRALGEECK